MLAVLGLAAAPDDDAAQALAVRLTDELRALVSSSRFELSAHRDELADLQQLAGCPDRDAPACMAAIGAFLEVDFVIYGHLERHGAGLALRLDLMDVARRVNRRAFARDDVTDPRRAAKDGFAKLAGAW
jgi:hypothetical protein